MNKNYDAPTGCLDPLGLTGKLSEEYFFHVGNVTIDPKVS